MITILYPYRNRELQRIKISMDSLVKQSNKEFNVLFVDYGSEYEIVSEVQNLLAAYPFAAYLQTHTSNQPWSRAKAINVGLQNVITEFVFIADIDMIFRSDFTKILHEIKTQSQAVFFRVGFLNEAETKLEKAFNDYNIAFTSDYGAQGLSLFPTEALKKVSGFDEFFHFWGAEDEDIHQRLKIAGYKTQFYDHEIVMLHRWHLTYRSMEKKVLTKALQLFGIIRINQQHQLHNKTVLKDGIVNQLNWGEILTQEEYQLLENTAVTVTLLNRKEIVDHFLFSTLHHFKDGILSVKFEADSFQKTLKYKAKKLLGKTVPEYYSLKEINDKLLLHIISFYHQFPYSYQVSNDLKSIVFKIKK